MFFLGLTVLSSSIIGALKCISMNNQECKVRPKIVSCQEVMKVDQ